MKRIIAGLTALALVSSVALADTTDVKKEVINKGKEISAPHKAKADSLAATAKDKGAKLNKKVGETKAALKAEGAAKKAEMEKWVTTPSGLKVLDTKIGTGVEAKTGTRVAMYYTGWLWENGAKGKQFDSSRDGNPYPVTLGNGEVIRGWDEGIVGMKEGGQRTLIIPPDLAYGDRGFPGAIPPKATLIFELELAKILK